MRKYGLVATASLFFFMAPVFALTVELVNEYQVSAAPVLAAIDPQQEDIDPFLLVDQVRQVLFGSATGDAFAAGNWIGDAR